MSTRKWGMGAIAVALSVGLNVVPVEAQRGFGRRGMGPGDPGGPNMGRSIELALENRDALEITDDQALRLQELQKVVDEEIAPLAETMKALRESVRSGDLDREEGLREMEALRGRIITAGAPLRGGVTEVLTVLQHQKLQAIVAEGRAGLGRGLAAQGRQGPGVGQAAGMGRGPGMGRGGPAGRHQGRRPGIDPVRGRGIMGPGNRSTRQGIGLGFGARPGMGVRAFPPPAGGNGRGPGGVVGDPGEMPMGG